MPTPSGVPHCPGDIPPFRSPVHARSRERVVGLGAGAGAVGLVARLGRRPATAAGHTAVEPISVSGPALPGLTHNTGRLLVRDSTRWVRLLFKVGCPGWAASQPVPALTRTSGLSVSLRYHRTPISFSGRLSGAGEVASSIKVLSEFTGIRLPRPKRSVRWFPRARRAAPECGRPVVDRLHRGTVTSALSGCQQRIEDSRTLIRLSPARWSRPQSPPNREFTPHGGLPQVCGGT